jgi:putative flavoprotein involved in K+ transport
MNDLSRPENLRRHCSIAIIGGGQAGLSMSYCLKARGIDHLVFERHGVGHEWRENRWNSFCLVTPNWQCKLPGFPYRGEEPNGFMKKDEIVRYIEDYVASFHPPLLEEVNVSALRRDPAGGYELSSTAGDFTADQVVVAIGGYHVASVPRMAERLPPEIAQLHSQQYRDPRSLPDGEVLIVGSGQSGCQIAEDLHLAGRRVHLCVGGAPRTARRYRGKDVVDWLADMGYYDMPVHEHPLKERVRAKANHYVTGRDGGRDIDLRKFALEGMQLYGRLIGVQRGCLEFAGDLAHNLDQADAVAESIKATIDKFIDAKGMQAPSEPRYTPPWRPAAEVPELDLARSGIRSVIWSIGYHSDYRWIEVPVFDGKGYPCHQRGVTSADGLYFIGLPWLYTWGSGRFSGVAQDAEYLAGCIAARSESRAGDAADSKGRALNELALGS